MGGGRSLEGGEESERSKFYFAEHNQTLQVFTQHYGQIFTDGLHIARYGWSRCPLVLCMHVCAVRSVQTFACALCISLDIRGAVRGEQFCLGGVFACVVEQWACVVFLVFKSLEKWAWL